ncbi:protein decapping 5-like isoform X3 [Juglans microcarpa x Juglans regia]|uniref:protein decapping 5-like isoform X3 n=1 Tax=Juglans microcarpa x Juglans regia TaxID=2249226 RepID=UPI001B7D9A81|nr:protein decapping 5-like isoform X3 [Juglans microcarpa x Juglans regia]
MASESASRSSTTSADSYIGSLISLTSKSEIRYEGVLYNINTQESSIGLENVRSFGTEGRKKDGPQVPPGDKIYKYILFRGSDIKDLQVKSSPPVQPMPPINIDPAIIQSHYARPISTSTSLPPAVSGSLTDISSHSAQLGPHGSSFQGGLPLYQPGGNIASWGATPPPSSANGGGLAMPMYWQGYYGPPNGLPHLHQQSLLRPPPGLPMPSSLQLPVQYPNFNVSLPSGSSNLPEVPSPLPPASSSSMNLSSSSLAPSTLPSTLPPVPSVTLASETLVNSVPSKAPPSSGLPTITLGSSMPSLAPLAMSSPDINAILPPISNKPSAIPGPILSYQASSRSTSSIVGTSNTIHAEAPAPSLVTPGQLLQSVPSAVASSQTLQTVHKDAEVDQVSSSSSESIVPVPAEGQPPLLPLPVPSRTSQKSSRPVTKFSEDFDFIAMNEKFKKDEVWGHLGKSNKSHSREGDGEVSDEDDTLDDEDAELSKFEVKQSVYNKDDFFDSLSCNSLNHESQNGRSRFSEQMKIDTETFGDFTRYRGGRGGRGSGRGGRFRGGYYGRGYNHVGRGRGPGIFGRSP